MSAIYCSNCGAKHTYTYAAPKFCSSCGTSVGAVLGGPPKQAATRQREEDSGDDYEDEDDGNTNSRSVPQLRKIEVDIETFDAPQITLGAILQQPFDPSLIAKRPTRTRMDDFVTSRSNRGE